MDDGARLETLRAHNMCFLALHHDELNIVLDDGVQLAGLAQKLRAV
jgi:hypothetical protein